MSQYGVLVRFADKRTRHKALFVNNHLYYADGIAIQVALVMRLLHNPFDSAPPHITATPQHDVSANRSNRDFYF